MARTQHGARARYRNSQPTLHFNSNAHEGQHRGYNNAVRGTGGDMRYNLRSATTMRTQGIQGTSRRGEVGENINMGTQEGGDDVPESQEKVQGIQGRAAIKMTRNWTSAQLQQALDAIIDEDMKIRTASRKFGIPPTSLRDHLFGTILGRKRGPKTVLNESEEKKLVNYCFKMQELGHHLTPLQLKLKVAQTTQTRDTPWSDIGVPRKSWLKSFRQRHPELVARRASP